jgi:hypothetical protein
MSTLLSAAVPMVLACATCQGDATSQAIQARDGAIIVMLSILAGMMSLAVYLIYSFAKKQRLALQELGHDS